MNQKSVTALLLALFLSCLLLAQEVQAPVTYEVKWGDTLAKLAYKYYGSGKLYTYLAEANNISDSNIIICGQTLVIPPNPETVLSQLKAPGIESVIPAQEQTQPVPEPVKQPEPAQVEPPLPPPPFVWRQEINKAWSPGEELDFNIKWQFITVGYAVMAVHPTENFNNRRAYHIYTEAKSAPFFDNFYKVRNTNESWIDTESLASFRFISRINEGKVFKTETLLLDQEKSQFTLVEANKCGPIPPWVQDILSSLYYLRTKEMSLGQEFIVDAHSGDTSWPLRIKVTKREKIRVPAGEFDCWLLEPAIREGAGIFQQQGQLWIWVTTDAKKMPVRMNSKVAIGSVDVVLTKYK